MQTGIVKFFNTYRGFGFIVPDDGKDDVFVHISEAQRAGYNGLNEGDRVEFDVATDSKSGKAKAINLYRRAHSE